ncbi:TolC family protein [Marinifilum caeruleilacunae]|uniref:TolC family protein n=1 Tax=Marinifilum caeruleilacunae TaxID=2499076 RepID=A0ABX1X0F1_9BACT|nr:TolC family protein [Marinifilum caeruleilacunae]NOU61890.1 TolC family protein [Marinifilum caeruleilacunae]
MRNIIYLLTFVLAMTNIQMVFAQETELKLSLKDALQMADETNRQINKAKEQGKAAKAEFRQTNSVFLPNLNLSHTAVSTNDPLATFGFKLKQEITTQADFNPILLNEPARIENYNTKIEVQQPIINIDGLYGRKAANAKMQAVDFTTERTINYTRFEVKKAYYQLELAQEAVRVVEKSLETAKAALQLTQNNLEQGYVKEADLLSAKVCVLELNNQLADAKNAKKQAGEFLAYILGLDIRTVLLPTEKLDQKPSLLQALNKEEDKGMRSDIMAYKKSLEARENMLKSEKMKFLPRLNAFGAYEWNDSQLMGTSANNYMIGASLSWNIFSGYKNVGKVQKARAELKIAELELADYQSKSGMEIQAAKRNLKVAFDRIEMSKMAKEQAEEAFRIRTNRYKQGLEKTIDVLQSESMAMMKNLDYINSLYQYHVAVFQLELLLEKELQ